MPNRALFQQIANCQIFTTKQNISPSRNPSQNDRAIIQNGKLIGAVTHVFIDNPKRGYGVYVDWMLQDMSEME